MISNKTTKAVKVYKYICMRFDWLPKLVFLLERSEIVMKKDEVELEPERNCSFRVFMTY